MGSRSAPARSILGRWSTHPFDDWVAQHYAELSPRLFDAETLRRTVDFLADHAGPGPVLELGIGQGRVALPLSRRGIEVHGIELSRAMVAQLRTAEGADEIEVTLGDFSTTKIGASCSLVFLVRNTITNVTSQDGQVATFQNAAEHLRDGGCFVIENYIPNLQRLPPGETTYLFVTTPTHIGYEEYDLGVQIAVSHHHWTIEGKGHRVSSPHRYLWPSELDLMARLAGLTLVERWADWDRSPFNADSRSHVSVWQKAGGGAAPRSAS
jgi:SAM-dependent methyltransferase